MYQCDSSSNIIKVPDGVEPLAQDKQTAGNSLNHLDQLTPAQQQALENQINNATVIKWLKSFTSASIK